MLLKLIKLSYNYIISILNSIFCMKNNSNSSSNNNNNNNNQIKIKTKIIKSLLKEYHFINFLIHIISKIIYKLISYIRYNIISSIINNVINNIINIISNIISNIINIISNIIRNKYNNKKSSQYKSTIKCIYYKYKNKNKYKNNNNNPTKLNSFINNLNNNINNIFAFSLIELSIVLIIIGLLVAGITGGQSLIESAKIKALGDEINSYKQAYFTFKALNGRAPGDLNGSGSIGLFSGQTYNSNSFPDPYNSNDKNGIPNEISAPFVDLYLAKIIDFEPAHVNGSSYQNKNDLGRPKSKIIGDSQYYYEYGKEDLNNKTHYKYRIKPGNHITIRTIQKINPKYLQSYDLKYDDGIYNNGSIRSSCVDGYTDYNTSILNNTVCSISITSLDY